MNAAIPNWLPRSAFTDLSMIIRDLKPAARLQVGTRAAEMRRWARRHGMYSSSDQDGYVVIAKSAARARRALDLDRRPGRHTVALGLMLGYPQCCSRAAARAGDEGIDALHARICALPFHGRFRMIDPVAYLDGGALISHVPCSNTCSASLALALRHSHC